jgi:hypothetical protein
MAKVTQIGEDTYEVSDFVDSMPHLRFDVTFVNDEARVTAREGTLANAWDRQAIEAVKFYLLVNPGDSK